MTARSLRVTTCVSRGENTPQTSTPGSDDRSSRTAGQQDGGADLAPVNSQPLMAEVTQLYGGRDPRELPNYSITEVASYLWVPRSTVSPWVKGMGRTFKPVLELADPENRTL